jgi:hypothetical protein
MLAEVGMELNQHCRRVQRGRGVSNGNTLECLGLTRGFRQVVPQANSPLWLATKCGRTRVVDLLLQQGNRVDINCRNNKDGLSEAVASP